VVRTDGGEHILEVSAYPLDEVCRKLHTRLEDGPLLAEIYRLAAAFRRHRSVSSDIAEFILMHLGV
jgi:hypothetical protein